jgi:hypothetical protein
MKITKTNDYFKTNILPRKKLYENIRINFTTLTSYIIEYNCATENIEVILDDLFFSRDYLNECYENEYDFATKLVSKTFYLQTGLNEEINILTYNIHEDSILTVFGVKTSDDFIQYYITNFDFEDTYICSKFKRIY